jgi:hypothetical protein
MDICTLAECDKPVKRGGYCYGHYMKNWRYGTPTPEHPKRHWDLEGKRFGTLTVLHRDGRFWVCSCDCGGTRKALSNALVQYGDINTCGMAGRHLAPTCGYGAAHDRLRRLRGAASHHACVDCGRNASHWSYDHADADELLAYGLSANPISYSAKPEHYVPRCVPCHKRHDLSVRDANYSAA